MKNKEISNYRGKEILHQLDLCAQDYNFPVLNNIYIQNADIRLTVFRNSQEWLIVFEEIGYSQKHSFINDISAFGNKLVKLGTQQAIPIINLDENREILTDILQFKVRIYDTEYQVDLSEDELKKSGVLVDPQKVLEPIQILRFLTSKIPDKIFLSEVRLLEICNRQNKNLKKFIRLDDWNHPNIADDEKPSQNRCFQSLAKAIEKNIPGLYKCSEEDFNTHWSIWLA